MEMVRRLQRRLVSLMEADNNNESNYIQMVVDYNEKQ